MLHFARRAGVGLVLVGAAMSAQTPLPLSPSGVAYDAAGNLYFADTNRHQVYESSLAGVLTVVAGSGVQGFSGDGGLATSAQMDSPQGVAVGADGTLYIADTGNNRIRTVSGGQIRTLAGSGRSGSSGDGGPASAATFNKPNALAIEPDGALLVCDGANHRIRRIMGGTVTAFAGSGVQGFSGDGGSGLSASFDSPSGVVVDSSGRVYVADSHNDRIRMIATDGTVQTFAGSGQRGFAGDGGVATAAKLAMPRGVIVMQDGSVVFADSNNQRIRMVNAQGIVSTLAGNGVQGMSADGVAGVSAALDSPRGVAASSFGAPVFGEVGNRLVRVLTGANVYQPAGLVPARVSTVSVVAPSSTAYGQASAVIAIRGTAGTPQGTVTLLDGGSSLGQFSLAGGTVSILLPGLAAGVHALTASYEGDGLNPGASSAALPVVVRPASLTATANPAGISYGQPIPVLTGVLEGVLAQDVGKVLVSFTSMAVDLSPAGVYPVSAALTGSASANYSVTMSPKSGALTIAQAQSTVALQAPPTAYVGLPMVLTAVVTPAYRGVPAGTMSFRDGPNVIASATVVSGVGSVTYSGASAGSHTITASYSGDNNFLASSSAEASVAVNVLPDFSVTPAGSSVQTVQAAAIATYTIQVSALQGPFTGAVSMSASSVPVGATVSFAPQQVVPGAGSALVTVSVQTTVGMARVERRGLRRIAWLACALPLIFFKRRGSKGLALVVSMMLFASVGCGARTLSTAGQATHSYNLVVAGTSTNLAGAVVVHSTGVTLTVQ